MLNKICKIIIITFFICSFSAINVFSAQSPYKASGYLPDDVGDESEEKDIVAVSWSVDKNLQYMSIYTYRLEHEGDWNYSINIEGDSNPLQVDVYCQNANQTVTLYDTVTNKVLYSSTTIWAESSVSYVKLPIEDIVSSIGSGYEFNFNVVSGDDYAPDTGYIKISTIPTYPWEGNIVLLLFPLIGFALVKKKKLHIFKIKGLIR